MTLLADDRDLLDAFREGRPEALERVYRHYVRSVATFVRHGFVYSRGGRPASFAGVSSAFEVENFVQEVFTRAFAVKTRLAYDGLRPYAAFLRGIARNVVLDHIRTTARRGERIESHEALEQHATDGAATAFGEVIERTPAETLHEQHGRALVDQFLASQCDDRDRRLYGLRYAEELSQQRAAEAAGLTRIQVRRWETGFRQRLLRFLKRNDYIR